MPPRKGPDGPAFAGIAAAGIVLGHAAAYLIAIPDAVAREQLLARTGHAYLPAAMQLALVVALAGVGSLLLRRASGVTSPRLRTSSSVATRLSVVQVSIFATMETIERLITHVPLGEMLRDHVLFAGLGTQVLVALVGAVILRLLTRASGRIAGVAERLQLPRPKPVIALADRATSMAPRRIVGASGVRGPPPR